MFGVPGAIIPGVPWSSSASVRFALAEKQQSSGPNSETSQIIAVSSLVETKLIEHFHRHPEELHKLPSRRFEELIAELFKGFGYEVELTQQTRDGGKDVIAVRKTEVEVKYLIECKRPGIGKRISVGTVRELLGVKTSEKATKAILATTVYFSPDAKELIEKHQWELEGRDFDGLRDWLRDYLGRRPDLISGQL